MSDTRTYTTISGDTWDLIAYKVYGDGMYMDLLIKENIKYKDIYTFPAGVILFVPEIAPETQETLPPWKQGAEEYGK